MISLTDEELSALDGLCRPETQEKVDAALARLHAQTVHTDLTPALAGFVADAITEARKNGRLIWSRWNLCYCSLCKKSAGYYQFKSGRRAGQDDLSHPLKLQGVELAYRFMVMDGYATLGGCAECLATVQPALVSALADVPCQLPTPLVTAGNTTYTKHEHRKCKGCGWEGHEGEMGRRRTLIGDGTYPAVCPSCGEASSLGRNQFDHLEGFTLVENQPKSPEHSTQDAV